MNRVNQQTGKGSLIALLGIFVAIMGTQTLVAQDYYYEDDDYYYQDQYEEDGYWDEDGYFIPVASHDRHAPPVRYNRPPNRNRRHAAHHNKQCRPGWCSAGCVHHQYVNKAPRYRQRARFVPRYHQPPRYHQAPRHYYRNRGPRVSANVRIGPLHVRIRN